MHCHGSPDAFIEADCGNVGPHEAHDYAASEQVCLGSVADFIEASCGYSGPHHAHPLNTKPEEATR